MPSKKKKTRKTAGPAIEPAFAQRLTPEQQLTITGIPGGARMPNQTDLAMGAAFAQPQPMRSLPQMAAGAQPQLGQVGGGGFYAPGPVGGHRTLSQAPVLPTQPAARYGQPELASRPGDVPAANRLLEQARLAATNERIRQGQMRGDAPATLTMDERMQRAAASAPQAGPGMAGLMRQYGVGAEGLAGEHGMGGPLSLAQHTSMRRAAAADAAQGFTPMDIGAWQGPSRSAGEAVAPMAGETRKVMKKRTRKRKKREAEGTARQRLRGNLPQRQAMAARADAQARLMQQMGQGGESVPFGPAEMALFGQDPSGMMQRQAEAGQLADQNEMMMRAQQMQAAANALAALPPDATAEDRQELMNIITSGGGQELRPGTQPGADWITNARNRLPAVARRHFDMLVTQGLLDEARDYAQKIVPEEDLEDVIPRTPDEKRRKRVKEERGVFFRDVGRLGAAIGSITGPAGTPGMGIAPPR